jgi:hypothetical protein
MYKAQTPQKGLYGMDYFLDDGQDKVKDLFDEAARKFQIFGTILWIENIQLVQSEINLMT